MAPSTGVFVSMCAGARVTDFRQSADEARQRLLAELERTAATFGEAERRAEGSSARVREAVANLETLRGVIIELLEQATQLHREATRLSGVAREATAPQPAPVERPEPRIKRETPLDAIDSVRESIAETPIDLRPRRRRRFGTPPPADPPAQRTIEITDGLRVFVEQLRIAGEDDIAIARHLEQIGVENPATVVSRIPRPEDSLAS